MDEFRTYSILQACICAVASIALFSIWHRGYRSETGELLRDKGVGLLCLACVAWTLAGILGAISGESDEPFVVLLSVLNSLFVLGAITHFDVVLRDMKARRWVASLLVPLQNIWI